MNKSRLTLYLSIGFFVAGGLSFYGALRIAFPSAAAARGLSLLQTAVQTADEIEVSFLSKATPKPTQARYRTKAFPEEFTITSSQRLTSDQTKQLLGILQQHVFDPGGGAMCHDPGFVLRFARQGRTLLTGSLCLHCTNLEIEPFPFAPIWISIFDKEAKDMRLQTIEKFLATLREAAPLGAFGPPRPLSYDPVWPKE
ncbi:MAG: hypothetical protein QOE70_2461 [Chthoniobacter sp.]|jgi:hypothetical protein|nr:hypothetical protein [Chthoniobacter sp.]